MTLSIYWFLNIIAFIIRKLIAWQDENHKTCHGTFLEVLSFWDLKWLEQIVTWQIPGLWGSHDLSYACKTRFWFLLGFFGAREGVEKEFQHDTSIFI